MILLPPDNVVSLDDYRRRKSCDDYLRDAGIGFSNPPDPRAYDVARIRREWDRVAEAAGHGDLDSAA